MSNGWPLKEVVLRWSFWMVSSILTRLEHVPSTVISQFTRYFFGNQLFQVYERHPSAASYVPLRVSNDFSVVTVCISSRVI